MNAQQLREYHKPPEGSHPIECPMDKSAWEARAKTYDKAAAFLLEGTFEDDCARMQAQYVSYILRRDAARCRQYGTALD